VRDPKTQADAVAIMAAKVGVKPADYAAAIPGTHFTSLAESKKHFQKGKTFESLYGSTKVANDFNVANKVYKDSQVPDEYIYPDFVLAL
jgi:NitT/TauT family transport system substrate-binding protein